MSKKLVVMVALLPLVWPVNSQAQTGIEMIQQCESKDSYRMACGGFLYGVAGTMTTYEQLNMTSVPVCLPEVFTQEQLRLVYIDWAKSNPDYLHMNAPVPAIMAILEAFHCEQ